MKETFFISSKNQGLIVVNPKGTTEYKTVKFGRYMVDETGLTISEFVTFEKAEKIRKQLGNRQLLTKSYQIINPDFQEQN